MIKIINSNSLGKSKKIVFFGTIFVGYFNDHTYGNHFGIQFGFIKYFFEIQFRRYNINPMQSPIESYDA